jgi:mycothiol synthase
MTHLTIRHYLPNADLPALLQLLITVEAHDHDGENISEEGLRAMEARPTFQAEKNVWVAEAEGQLVGFGQALPKESGQCSAYVAVHPEQRRRGLGQQLFDLILGRAREAQSTSLLIYANGFNQAATAFLHKQGFAAMGESGAMFLPVSDLPAAKFPEGYSLRRYDPSKDEVFLVQALNDCYRGMWGHQQEVESAAGYAEYYGTEGIHLLFDGAGQLVSVCAGKAAGRQNERGLSDLLDAPGVVQARRGENFQREMVLAVIDWLREQGQNPVTLEFWGETEKGLQAYRELGFKQVTQFLAYHKELR